MKRLKFLFVTLALLIATGAMAGNVQLLVLDLADGSRTVIPLQDQPIITCQAGELQVSVAGEVRVTASLSDVAKYSFADQAATAIETVENEESRLEMGHILVSNAHQGEVVRIYTADGKQVAAHRIGNDGQADIDLTSFNSGLYIVKTAKSTIKVFNK